LIALTSGAGKAEVHVAPEQALCDGAQALRPAECSCIVEMLKGIMCASARDKD
jgi:3-deoxy-D-arabino-heptulosonate 7-phosphate (DAHP) synthase